MDGLARITGHLYREIAVGSQMWRLAAPRLEDLAALESAILSRLPDPIEQAARHAHLVPSEQQARYWEAAFAAAAQQRRFRLENLEELPESLQLAAAAFLVLRRHHGQQIKTLDDALVWLEQAREQHGPQISAILTAAANEGAVGGSSSENPTTTQTA
jgi:hypothetical protein